MNELTQENFIPFVHTDRSKESLAELQKHAKEITLSFEGQEIQVLIFDFRSETAKKENQIQYPQLTLYFMGFPQIETVKPNDLTGGILDRAQKNGSVVIIPRFKEIPNTPNLEATLVLQALSSEESSLGENILAPEIEEKTHSLRGTLREALSQEGIDIDLTQQNVEIISYSDGGRVGIKMAGYIDTYELKQKKDGSFPTRTLIALSATNIIDEIPNDQEATGKTHVDTFNKQVFWAVIEEVRLRLNALIQKEKNLLNQKAHEWIAGHDFKESAESYKKLQDQLLASQKKDGSSVFPLLKNNFALIEDAQEAFDSQTTLSVIKNLSKLVTFPEGITHFVSQVKESSQENLGMLFDVIKRAATARKKHTYDTLNTLSEVELIYQGVLSLKAMNKQFSYAEKRLDTVCNSLESFDIRCVWPSEDLTSPDKAYGQTFRRLFSAYSDEEKNGILNEIPEEGQKRIQQALEKEDDTEMGKLFIEYSFVLGKILFPKAKSVSIRFTGKRGVMAATHLAPMKKSKLYLPEE